MIRKPECDDFTLWLFLVGVGCIETLFKPIDLVSPLTAQNSYFVQLVFVQAGWCLLHAACKGLLGAGRKACVLLQGQVYHPLQHSFLLKQNAHTDETSA